MAIKKETRKSPASSLNIAPHSKSSSGKLSFFSFKNTSLYNRKNFAYLSVIVFFILVLISLDFGVNGDEKFQVNYSQKLWSYYSSFGKDTSALYVRDGNMHLYGGLFDLTAISLNKLMGLTDEYTPAYHSIRRVLCAVFGFIAILFASLFGKQIGGWPLAFLTLVLMLLSPRFLGDAMINPKDIPFAAGYIMALYFISKFIRELPKPTAGSMIGIITGVMIALNTRAGGLLLILYLFLFVALFLFQDSRSTQHFDKKAMFRSGVYTLIVGFLAYLAGIVFWPYALANPLLNPLKALTEFTHQPITISVLFAGQHMSSDHLPWNYIPEWMLRTIPLFSLVGLFFMIRLLKPRYQDLSGLEIFMLGFSILFPVLYAIYKQSALHDGWRHFLFVYPSLVLIASLGWYLWFTSFSSKAFRLFSALLLTGLLAENLFSIISLHPYQYVYFNPLLGGVKKAYGNFETDYWMLSVKEAAEWLIQHEKIDRQNKSFTIATNCMYPAQVYLRDTSKHIKLIYTNYYDRSSKPWDYGIFYSRFVHRNQLFNHTWPPRGTIKIIKANGIPLCAVVRRENQDDYLGFEAIKRGDAPTAIKHFLAALDYAPDNETVSYMLADIYKNNCLYEKAEEMIQQSLAAFPANLAALQLLEDIKTEKLNY
ncbi:MAG: tetratricopeptide repeat protein [Saprospiraceae bacterium]|nr:tetratricopeptide repeat protein [Saprospiraceae bacterium]